MKYNRHNEKYLKAEAELNWEWPLREGYEKQIDSLKR
jgi:hypothetical protein